MRRGRLVALGLLLLVSTTGCDVGKFLRLGMPKPITKEGEVILELWQGSWIAALAVGVFVWALIAWTVIFHRRKSDELPRQVRYNLPIEVLYLVVPFIMVSVLFYFTVKDLDRINDISSDAKLTVRVTGFQWSWKFTYPEEQVTVVGRPGENPTLVVPVETPVRFELRSDDVVHSFWIPALLFKRDLIPGHPNQFAVTFTEQGTFAGRCSELCGTYHSRMLFTLKVVSPDEFQDFIDSRQAQPVAESAQ